MQRKSIIPMICLSFFVAIHITTTKNVALANDSNPNNQSIAILSDDQKNSCNSSSTNASLGTLTGTITANGSPVSNATINISKKTYDCNVQGGSSTSSTGYYSISAEPGNYYLKITPPQNSSGQVFAPYYYEDEYNQCGSVKLITITASASTTLDINLTQPGGLITGTIVSYDNKPISGANVYCSRDTDYMSYGTTTNSNGVFTSGPHYPADNYKCFIYDNGKALYYDNANTYSNRTLITVSANTITQNINFQLSKPAGTKAVTIPLNQ